MSFSPSRRYQHSHFDSQRSLEMPNNESSMHRTSWSVWQAYVHRMKSFHQYTDHLIIVLRSDDVLVTMYRDEVWPWQPWLGSKFDRSSQVLQGGCEFSIDPFSPDGNGTDSGSLVVHLHLLLLPRLQHVRQVCAPLLLPSHNVRALAPLGHLVHGVCCIRLWCQQHSRHHLPMCTDRTSLGQEYSWNLRRHQSILLFQFDHHDRQRHHSLRSAHHLYLEAAAPSHSTNRSQPLVRIGCIVSWLFILYPSNLWQFSSVVAASFIRLYVVYRYDQDGDLSWNIASCLIWSSVENHLAVFIACSPSIKAVVSGVLYPLVSSQVSSFKDKIKRSRGSEGGSLPTHKSPSLTLATIGSRPSRFVQKVRDPFATSTRRDSFNTLDSGFEYVNRGHHEMDPIERANSEATLSSATYRKDSEASTSSKEPQVQVYAIDDAISPTSSRFPHPTLDSSKPQSHQ